jgi:hypothetical protein
VQYEKSEYSARFLRKNTVPTVFSPYAQALNSNINVRSMSRVSKLLYILKARTIIVHQVIEPSKASNTS